MLSIVNWTLTTIVHAERFASESHPTIHFKRVRVIVAPRGTFRVWKVP